MKIEMGESLFYSWLRHVKECQIVQTNWKVSPKWKIENEKVLFRLMSSVDEHFYKKYGYRVFKKNTSIAQLLRQAECDAFGIHIENGKNKTYAVDVAFHENGLNYGSCEETTMKIIEKCARTAFCLYGYLNSDTAEVIFASPKINPSYLAKIEPCIEDLNEIFSNNGIDFFFCLISNEEFNNQVLEPILRASDGISDTTELFLRSYKLYTMFADKLPKKNSSVSNSTKRVERGFMTIEEEYINSDDFCEYKVGQIARHVLAKMLRDGMATEEEIEKMQTEEYSKEKFHLNYPLLVKEGLEFDKVRYYASPIDVYGKRYYLCSQWFETSANYDRPYLIKWIALHKDKIEESAN